MDGVFPDVMAAFGRACPRVELSLRCVTSRPAWQRRWRPANWNLALVKRVGDGGGATVGVLRREPMVWFVGEGSAAHRRTPLPVAVFHEGCVFRVAALAALAKAQRPWQISYAGNGFAGIRHAVAAGLAVTPLPRSLAGPGLVEVRGELPELPMAELITCFPSGEPSPAARRLVELIEARLWGPAAAAA